MGDVHRMPGSVYFGANVLDSQDTAHLRHCWMALLPRIYTICMIYIYSAIFVLGGAGRTISLEALNLTMSSWKRVRSCHLSKYSMFRVARRPAYQKYISYIYALIYFEDGVLGVGVGGGGDTQSTSSRASTDRSIKSHQLPILRHVPHHSHGNETGLWDGDGTAHRIAVLPWPSLHCE